MAALLFIIKMMIDMAPIFIDGVKPNLYKITEDGQIWSNYKKGFLHPRTDKDGYLQITLSGGDRQHKKYFRIGTLVALTYIGPPSQDLKDPTINHIDGNILNNHYSNLEWVERGYNSSIRKNKGEGSNNHEAKLTEQQVIEICELLVNTNLNYTQICNKYNIKKSTISSIKNKKTWKKITSQYDFSCRQTIRNEKGQFENININLLSQKGGLN